MSRLRAQLSATLKKTKMINNQLNNIQKAHLIR